MNKPTEKIKVTSCRFCVFEGGKSCNLNNDVLIADNVESDSINESCPLKDAVVIVELDD